MHLECCSIDCNDDVRSCLRSSVMLAVIVEVSISIPRKIKRVVGPSILDGLTGAFIFWHNESMAERLFEHS